MLGCRRRLCNTCWLRRQLMGVGVLALVAYWVFNDAATQETCTVFGLLAVIFLLVVRHED